MKLPSIRQISVFIVAAAAGLSAALTSCNAVYDDEPYCNQGLSVRFIYDYNMEFANAFPSQVHCLTVFVYDEDGNYIQTVTETDGAKLGDENWRMHIDLPEGKYTLLAYGGMQCSDASFLFTHTPAPGSVRTEVGVELNPDCITAPVGTELHPLFYGDLDVTEVGYNDPDYVQVTVPMMKDTNNLRILLQNVDGTPVYSDDYIFTITDNNTLFNYNNTLLPAPEITYHPWAQGDIEGGQTEEGTQSIVAYSEFSTSRFITSSTAKLTIIRASDGRTVLSIPLVKYLMMLKSQHFDWMGGQEFLDRESWWNMVFFLDSTTGGWITTQIIINDWVVRINDITDF